MSLARLVVTAVRIEGRSKAEVSRDYGVSPRWVYELCRRFDAEGEPGLQPRSRRPWRSPQRIPEASEDEIVEVRKHLSDQGLDAGAHTIAYHLTKRHGTAPSVATIWRILSRRGFVTPQPQKRPRSSFIRFQADQPNERWQADITHWHLADDTEVEILNVIDDHSRFLVASDVRRITKAADVVASFHRAAAAHGFPASLLTDNGAVFTAAPRKGRCAIELETAALGIAYVHSSPITPRPAARLSAFTRPRRSGSPSRNQRRPSSSSKRSSIASVRTTTTSDRTGRSGDEPLPRRSQLGRGRPRGCRGSWSLPTSGSAGTRSISAGRSRCATTRGCTTSG
jgi:transposase